MSIQANDEIKLAASLGLSYSIKADILLALIEDTEELAALVQHVIQRMDDVENGTEIPEFDAKQWRQRAENALKERSKRDHG